MKKIFWYKIEKNKRDVFQIISLLLVLPSILRAQNTLGCPDLIRSNECSCYTFEEGVFLDCQEATPRNVKNSLKSLSDIYSLRVYDFDDNEETLGPNIVPQGTCIKHIYISKSSVKDIADETFLPVRKCLETLSIQTSKIRIMPQKAFSGMLKLISIDLTANYIEEIPSYSFYGLPLIKLNFNRNMIRSISESAFTSLEHSLSELELSENNLTTFPIASLSKLTHLRTLRLAWNEMSSFPSVEHSELISLEYLDLNSNNFEFISEDCLKFCPSLSILSLHFNFINNIHYRAFYSLTNLKTLDLSFNRIKILNPNLFRNNKKLEFINLSNNHLHHVHGLFCNMPSLIKVFLSHNNILDVPIDSFLNSSKLKSIRLDKNSIRYMNSESFSNLEYLEELLLDFNSLNQVPHNIFISNGNIKKIRLDNNDISELGNNTFKNLDNVVDIVLSNNQIKLITRLNFINCYQIEELRLDHNKITFIEAGALITLNNLKYVSLNNNYLIDFNDVLPKVNSNLITLHLDSNLLSSVNNYMFQSQQKLSLLTLKNNRLKFLTQSTFRNSTHLKALELRNNEISIIEDFTFQRMNSLSFLDLRHNLLRNITNYTLFGLRELEELQLSYNQIALVFDMAFDTLKKLRRLNLSFNPIKIIQKNFFQQAIPLSSLYMDNCEIEFIENGTFQGLNNLKLLSLKNNSLKSTDILSIDTPGVKYLYLSYNFFDYLPVDSFSQLPLLEVLVLEHCNIEHIFEGAFINNKNLTKLNLAQNILSSIPTILFNDHNSIIEFNITNNFLDVIPYNTLYNFSQIKTLDITDNLLTKVELSGLEKLSKLKYLILKNNEIKNITAGKKIEFIELIVFDVSINRLDSLPLVIFEVFPNLQNINVSYNNIINFDFLMTYKRPRAPLINIDISKNPSISMTRIKYFDNNNTLVSNIYELHICATNMTVLDDISFDLLTNLRYLYLKQNKIRRLSIGSFSKLIVLENLDLSFNRITQLKTSNFRGLKKLKTLCLSNNNIESMESFAEDLSNLELLDLAHNKLQNILNEDLLNLKELKILYLNHNNIKYISVTAFRNLRKIIQIDLKHNKLQTIKLELLSSIENHVQDISIKDNTIICNCQKNNTWVWIQDHPKIIKSNEVSCLNNEYPKEKCNVPMISQLAVDKHKDNSVSVSWFIRNRTAIKALQVLYYGEDVHTEVEMKFVDATEVSTRIKNLHEDVNYIVCVIAIYEDVDIFVDDDDTITNNTIDDIGNDTTRISQDAAEAIIMRSPSSECATFTTHKKHSMIKFKTVKTFDFTAILNRRTGLIVGCSLGFVVFFFMVTILLYTKIKERKRIAKADPTWSEMTDYHSMQSKEEIIQHSTTASTDNILLGMTKSRNTSLDHYRS